MGDINIAFKKRGHPKFSVPNLGAKKRSRVKDRWRKQRGIDSKKRLKKDFAGAEPTIGYGNPVEARGVRASGKRAALVHNAGELRELLESPDAAGYEVTFASSLSKRKRAELAKLAAGSRMKVTNGV